MLNHFVFEDGGYLVNLTTKKSLPKESSRDLLGQNFFLKGQERDAIEHRLFGSSPTEFSINVIPTWECNLRCGHCFVLHELLKKDEGRIKPDMLLGFIKGLVAKYPTIKRGYLNFIGGEPTLRAEENLSLIREIRKSDLGISFGFAATSNGYQCEDAAIEFLYELDSLIISIDGPMSWHDKQRKPLIRGDSSPFLSSVNTVKRLVAKGMRNRLMVQASLPEEAMTKENVIDFYRAMLMCGVKYERIMVGFVAPAKQRPNPDDAFLEVSTRSAYSRPCCKYRFMSNFVVDSSNRVFCDFFDANQKNFIGFLSDPIDKIAEAHERVIKFTMPVLNDPKCADCPVIGLCWGWCANTKCLRPSDHCKPDILMKRARQNAEKGNLQNFLKNTKKNDLSDEALPKKQCCGGGSCG